MELETSGNGGGGDENRLLTLFLQGRVYEFVISDLGKRCCDLCLRQKKEFYHYTRTA